MEETGALHEQNINIFHLLNGTTIDAEKLKQYLSNKIIDLNQKNRDGESILHLLAANNDHGLLNWVLEQNPLMEIDVEPVNKQTPFLVAAKFGHINVIKTLEKWGCNLNHRDIDGRSAIHLATAGGHIQCVRYFVENNETCLELENKYGDTPLLVAAIFKQHECLQYILEKGANIYHLDRHYGESAFHKCAYQGNLRGMELIINHMKHQFVIKNHEDEKALQDVNRYIDQVDSIGSTALSKVSGYGHADIAEYLIKNGANVETCDNNGFSPLMRASMNGHAAIVDKLLLAGADIEFKNKTRNTSLLWAAGNGHVAVVIKLLSAKANANVQDHEGRTPLIWAAINGHEAVVNCLLKFNAADIEVRDHNRGNTALMCAAAGKLKLAQTNPRKKEPEAIKWRTNNYTKIVTDLINAGADVNIQNQLGRTALILAVMGGHTDVVGALLDAGADSTIRDLTQRTAFDWANQSNQWRMTALLHNDRQ